MARAHIRLEGNAGDTRLMTRSAKEEEMSDTPRTDAFEAARPFRAGEPDWEDAMAFARQLEREAAKRWWEFWRK